MKVASVLAGLWHGLLDLVYPPKCVVCGLLGFPGLCPACLASASALEGNRCARCAERAGTRRGCPECSRLAPVPFERTIVAGVYDGAMKRAIWRLKFDGRVTAAKPLGELLANRALSAKIEEPDLVIPVPLHSSRVCQRGFNQSERVARAMCESLGWRPPIEGLLRVRKTKSQTTLDFSARSLNVRGAFRADDQADLAGKSVVLVDDILTSLATVAECSRTLKEAGAGRITVVALARTDHVEP